MLLNKINDIVELPIYGIIMEDLNFQIKESTILWM